MLYKSIGDKVDRCLFRSRYLMVILHPPANADRLTYCFVLFYSFVPQKSLNSARTYTYVYGYQNPDYH